MATSVAFTPLQVGDLTLQHRISLAPCTRLRTHPDHTISDLAQEYYAQRASYPGTLLISEGNNISAAAGGWAFVPGCYTAKHVEAWKKVVDAGTFGFEEAGMISSAARC
jgi:NADPH2 dehydrogenase